MPYHQAEIPDGGLVPRVGKCRDRFSNGPGREVGLLTNRNDERNYR
jgi:hypothetical protein